MLSFEGNFAFQEMFDSIIACDTFNAFYFFSWKLFGIQLVILALTYHTSSFKKMNYNIHKQFKACLAKGRSFQIVHVQSRKNTNLLKWMTKIGGNLVMSSFFTAFLEVLHFGHSQPKIVSACTYKSRQSCKKRRKKGRCSNLNINKMQLQDSMDKNFE